MQTCNIKGAGQQLSVTRQAIIWGISPCATLAVLKRKRSQIIYGWLIEKINAGELHHGTKQSPGVHGGCRRAQHSQPGCLPPNSPHQGLVLGSGHRPELVWWPGHSSGSCLSCTARAEPGLEPPQEGLGLLPPHGPSDKGIPWVWVLPWLRMLQRFPAGRTALCGSSSMVYSSPGAVFSIQDIYK